MNKFVLLLGVLLSQCAPVVNEGMDVNPFVLMEKSLGEKGKELDRVKVAVLGVPSLAREWGAPKMLVGPKGGYGLRYENPRNRNEHVTVFGSPERYGRVGLRAPYYTDLKQVGEIVEPVEVGQAWQKGEMLGKPVKYCIAEAKSSSGRYLYQTETVGLIAPDGKFGSYRVRLEVQGGAERVKEWLQQVQWQAGGR